MVALDTTIVNVALHEIGTSLDAGAGIEWVVTAYLLGVCAGQPVTGWLTDRFGRRRVFLVSLLGFTVASALCALSPTLPALIGARALQGLGGGSVMPVGMAIALDLFPPARRGRAMALWGMAAMAAPAIGPTAGGWLVTAVSWHWLFIINLPIGVVVLMAGLRMLPHDHTNQAQPFDLVGLLIGSGGLTIGVLGVSQGSQWGWTAPVTLLCLIGGPILLVLFVVHERRRTHPLIELGIFSTRSFRLAVIAMMLVAIGQYGRLVFMPLQLQEVRGYTAFQVGLLYIPVAAGSALGMQVGGRLVDRIGPRKPIAIGFLGVSLSMLGFWRLDITTPLWVIGGLMAFQGFSWGTTMSPSLVAGMGEVGHRLIPQATAVRSLAQQVAAAIAVAILGAVAATRMGTSPSPEQAWRAYCSIYVVGLVGSLLAALVGWQMPNTVEDHEAYDEATVTGLLE